MKRLFIMCVLLAGITGAHAQTVADNTKWESNDNDRKVVAPDNDFVNTEMASDGKIVTLTDLPVMKKAIWVMVTNATGEVMTQRRMTPESNTVDVHRLAKHEIYYVTIVYKNKSKKAFVLQL